MPRLLIVEDNDSLRDMLRELFSQRGFDVFVASSGTDALVLMACSTIDVVLTDLDLPGLSGLDLCRELRRQVAGFGQNMPVWLMTGSDEPGIAKAALDAGVRGIFRKPFSTETAAVCIRTSLEQETSVLLRAAL